MFQLLARVVVVIHLGFVVFVVLGGLIVMRRPRLAWLHIPAAAWGVAVEYAGWVCPLTPLESMLRERAGLPAYSGGFIGNHLLPLLYPANLTRGTQILLGTVALAVNAFVYVRLARR